MRPGKTRKRRRIAGTRSVIPVSAKRTMGGMSPDRAVAPVWAKAKQTGVVPAQVATRKRHARIGVRPET